MVIFWVYVKTQSKLWTVGFYDPHGKWHPESDHDAPEHAADRCHFLNGRSPLRAHISAHPERTPAHV